MLSAEGEATLRVSPSEATVTGLGLLLRKHLVNEKRTRPIRARGRSQARHGQLGHKSLCSEVRAIYLTVHLQAGAGIDRSLRSSLLSWGLSGLELLGLSFLINPRTAVSLRSRYHCLIFHLLSQNHPRPQTHTSPSCPEDNGRKGRWRQNHGCPVWSGCVGGGN